MQLELLDRQPWATRQDLASAIFEWIETSHQRWLSSRCSRGFGEGLAGVVKGVVA